MIVLLPDILLVTAAREVTDDHVVLDRGGPGRAVAVEAARAVAEDGVVDDLGVAEQRRRCR